MADEAADLILVRHGETVGNSSVRLYGVTDVELSETGRRQMECVAAALAGMEFKRVIASPLKRSSEGALIVSAGRDPKPEEIAGFIEIDFGSWEGITLEEAAANDPVNYAGWKSSGMDFRFPGGESREEFRARAAAAAWETFKVGETPVLAVLHKGIIKVIFSALLGISFEEVMHSSIELGSIHRLRLNGGKWRMISENETAHLGRLRMPGT